MLFQQHGPLSLPSLLECEDPASHISTVLLCAQPWSVGCHPPCQIWHVEGINCLECFHLAEDAAAPPLSITGQDLHLVRLLRSDQTLRGCAEQTCKRLAGKPDVYWLTLLLGGDTPFTLPSFVTFLAPNLLVFHQLRFTLCPRLQDPSLWG